MRAFSINRRKALLAGIGSVLLTFGVISLLAKAASFHKTINALEQANVWWFIVCLAGELVAYTGYILAYRDFARAGRGPLLRWREAAQVVGIGIGASALGATAASLAVDYWALSRAGAKSHESARRVLALNTMQWANLSALAVLAAILALAGIASGTPLAMSLSWISIVPLCYISASWFSSPKRVRRFTKLPGASLPINRSPSTWRPWLGINLLRGFSDAIGGVAIVRHVMGRPRAYKLGNSGFYIFWAGDILALFASISAFGYHINLATLVLAYATAYLLTILPLPADGAGSMEAAITYSLYLVGMPLHLALVSALTFRFFTFWLPIVPAFILLPRTGKLQRQLANKPRDNSTPRIEHHHLAY